MIKKKNIFVLLLAAWLAGCAAEPDTIRHEGKGHIPALDSLILKEMEADHIPGAVLQVKQGGSVLHRAAYGFAKKYGYDLKPLGQPQAMTTGHLFDLASLTKVMATTYGIMLLLDRGRLHLDDPIHHYLPEFEEGEKARITIRNLLTHTAGLAQWIPTYYHGTTPGERYRHLADQPLEWPVGKERHYSDLGFMLLGDIIKRVSNCSLDEFLHEELYRPLGLNRTAFNPLEKGMKPIAATSHGNPFEKQMVYDRDFGYRVDVEPESWDGWRTYTLQGEVNDGNAWYTHGGVAGHAGLFSTVGDLQVLVDLLLNRGKLNGKQYISAGVVDRFLVKDRYGNGLGWAMDKQIIAAAGSPPGTFGHTGFTGTSVVAVPRDSLSVILLTNRQNVGRQKNGYYYDLETLRQAIFDTVEQYTAN
ncbi:serine hydrolase [Fodinibius sediminis]|nr:serine hydrolase [Fodinibius sediminis]